MPADAVAGLLEAVIGLVVALVEGFLLLIELVVEAIFVLVELVLWLFGKRRHLDRPGWVADRRNSATSRVKSMVLAAVIVAAAGYGAFQYWGFTRMAFFSGGFVRPDGITVRLIRDGGTGYATIEDGKLKVLRGRWDRIEILDPRYQASGFDLFGRRMDLRLERIQTTREAATEAVIDKAVELLRKKFDRGAEADEEE